MIKLLAEPKGPFQLYDLSTGDLLVAHRPSVINSSTFIQDRIGRDQVRVLGEVSEDATDADFAETWRESEGDRQLAIDSFLAEHVPSDEEKMAAHPAEPKQRRKRQAV